MNKIRYTELFYSCQGEARYTGVPSVFLRTFGCNFRCTRFNNGQDIAGQNHEVASIIEQVKQYPEQFPTFDSLPLAHTGCDSYPSVYTEFKHYAQEDTVDVLATKIVDLLPYKRWVDEHLVFTGGEPLLGWQRAYPLLLEHEQMHALKEITFETNGTQAISPALATYLTYWRTHPRREVTFSVSAKLASSGEPAVKAIKPEIVASYQQYGTCYLKFVVATDKDIDEVLRTTTLYRNAGFEGPVYIMPCGGTKEVYDANKKSVAEFALKYGLRYSDRLHVSLFGNNWAT